MSEGYLSDRTWLEFSVEVDAETAEALLTVFDRFGQGGAVVEIPQGDSGNSVQVKAYLAPTADQSQRRRGLEEALWHLGRLRPIPEPRIRRLQESDWAEAWKVHYKPLKVGRRLWVVPSWRESPAASGDIVIRLDPGMAFGTGFHPSTQLCLEALEEGVRPATQVLDLGTGSGILAIAAALLGANWVLALDVDALAIEAARRNVGANGVGEQVHVEYGSLEELGDQRFHLVVANIYADIILRFLERGLVDHLRPGGSLIASGLLAPQGAEVSAEFHRRGLLNVREMTREEWGAVVGHRAP